MKALGVTSFDGPEALVPLEVPEPSCGPHDVIVRVRTVAANRLDLAVLAGRGPGSGAVLPLVPGIDPAGTVAAVGHAVDDVTVGDEVVVKPNIACFACPECLAGRMWACLRQTIVGVDRPGGLAPRLSVPSANVFRLPQGVDTAEATAAVHSFPVALRMLREAGELDPGSTAVVLGAAGSVGSAAVQLLVRRGHRVVGVVSGAAKADAVTAMGATAIDRLGGEVDRRLGRDATDIALIIDTAGDPELTEPALDLLGWRGVYVTCASHGGGRISLDLGALYRSRRRLIGSAASGYDDVEEVLGMLARREVRPLIDRVMDVAEAKEAFRLLAGRVNVGKIVLRHPE